MADRDPGRVSADVDWREVARLVLTSREMDRIEEALWDCEVFVSIGTSGLVYPAAGFVQYALSRGAHTVELNLAASDASTDFHVSRRGPATELVPAYVEELLGERTS